MTFEPVAFEWTEKDVMLYALGVGCKPGRELDFIYEGRGPRVLPTFAVIPAFRTLVTLLARVEINPAMVLHGEQGLVVHRLLPPEANAQVLGKVTAVWDKGKAAVIEVETAISDAEGPLATSTASIFVRGAGGFGGERGPSADTEQTFQRLPDHLVKDHVQIEQGAIYRLSGDRNPIHIDPDFARLAGFDAPFLHGLCTYGIVGRALVTTACAGDPARFQSFTARFADRVNYGDDIITKLWVTTPGQGVLGVQTQKGNAVLSQARATWRTS
jgi:acyl dehydratase